MEIETSLNCCMTITFLNKAFKKPEPTVWVCEGVEAYREQLAKLLTMDHIKIVQSGPSIVKGRFAPRKIA